MMGKNTTGESAMYTLRYLLGLKTITTAQADDLKIEENGERVWLSRCSVEDGEPYNNKVTIEEFIDGRWEVVREYEAQ